ncbi:MAG TPA: peptide MFS transporter [Candidatus Saccharicenans sp.]|nr:peptide MFS transporter [Candidatus Saccharicenans sp.]HQO75971.1 peptide MFS transporter [Candidatus Saccharicenans sp.]HUM79126.1 peptide MFS transporter [Candidatus Saccharicenans sp.]
MLKKHPRALVYIFFTEMWERVGFYTLMAILVLYMDKILGWPDSKKGDWYGLFLALCYFFPLVGGYLGDRLFGRIKTIRTGAVLMAIGYVGLALSSANQVTTFLLGLLLIAIGTGIFKVNMAVMVGNIYKNQPELKDAGFNIYYMGVNLGAMIAPIIATVNSAIFHSYHLSFWVAAVGLILALVIFQAGKTLLTPVDDSNIRLAGKLNTEKGQQNNKETAAQKVAQKKDISSLDASAPGRDFNYIQGEKQEQDFSDRILTLCLLFTIVILFWVAFYQNGFALTLFAARSTVIKNWLRPETYQFFEPFFILVLTPFLLSIFNNLRQNGREPSTPKKIFYGLNFMILAMLIMVLACLQGGNKDQNIMSPLWLIGTYFVVTIAEILISPMGQSYVSKVAPEKIRGLMMGGWFVATAIGSYGSGLLGKLYSRFPHHQYFLLLACLLAVAAILALFSMKKLEKYGQ